MRVTADYPTTEIEWMRTTCGMLDAGAWSWIHYAPRRRARTRYTEGSTGSSAAGWPDLFAVRGDRAIALELKLEGRRPSAEQTGWLDRLTLAGVEAHIVTLPYDYGWLETFLQPDPEQMTFTTSTGATGAGSWVPLTRDGVT